MIGLITGSAACAIIALVVSLGAGHQPSTPMSRQIDPAVVHSIATNTSNAIRVTGSAIGAATTNAPIIGEHIDRRAVDAWINAVGSIPERFIEAGPRQLGAANVYLDQCNLGDHAASAMVTSVDLSLGVMLATIADPERAITLAFEP